MPRIKRPKRLPKTFDATLFCYVEEANAEHAKTHGKKIFGSFSAYVNALIARDREATPKLGAWKAEGESKAIREAQKNQKEEVKKEIPAPKVPAMGPGSPGYFDPIV